MDDIYDKLAAARMGIEEKGQVSMSVCLCIYLYVLSVRTHSLCACMCKWATRNSMIAMSVCLFVQVCVMIHSGSRGLGHQVATGRGMRIMRWHNDILGMVGKSIMPEQC